MIQTAETIIESVRALPKVEREKFFDWAEAERRRISSEEKVKKVSLKNEADKFQLAMKWIDENRQKYLGEWVCLDGDKLIANGADAVKLYREAKEKGIKVPFVEHIVEDEKPYGGGIEACPKV
jgi:Family of unknown function (DUF5678)